MLHRTLSPRLSRIKRHLTSALCIFLMLALSACVVQTVPTAPQSSGESMDAAPAVDLNAVKEYALENADLMQDATASLADVAQQYYDLVQVALKANSDADPYEQLWADNQEEISALVIQARDLWLEASTYYELDEGIVAGVPSLAHFDVWIDAGPPGSEDPEEALEWTLKLPDGRVYESPGNFFHNLLEPTLWGTNPEFTGLKVDMDGDGVISVGEALPEANMLLGATQGLNDATIEMQGAIEAWDPDA